MGIHRLTWSEVEAFSTGSGYPMLCWEKETVLAMSSDYCSSYYSGSEQGAAPPYFSGTNDEDALQAMRDKVARQWDSFEKGFAKNPRKARK